MPLRFPKQLTIRLPELQRAALQEIHKREPSESPAHLLEGLLAVGIMSRLTKYENGPESAPPFTAENGDQSALCEDVRLRLPPDFRARLRRATRGRPPLPLDDFVFGLFEWGLDAFEEGLVFVEDEGESTGDE